MDERLHFQTPTKTRWETRSRALAKLVPTPEKVDFGPPTRFVQWV